MSKVKKWEQREIDEATRLYREGYNYEEIGRVLGRVGGNVARKLQAKGVIKRTRTAKPFTDDEIEVIRKLHLKGYNYKEIGEEIGRTGGSVGHKLKSLGVAKNNPRNSISLWDVEYMRPYIVNEAEAKELTIGSSKKIAVRCGCGTEKEMIVKNLIEQGVTCPKCKKGTSYPELFFLAINEHFELGYEYQVSYEHGRFDFVNHNTKVAVEMNGLAHYQKPRGIWEDSYENTVKSDNKKRDWCKENGYTLIFIDSRKSEFEFIKDSINKESLLPTIKKSDVSILIEMIQQNKRYDTKNIIKEYTKGKTTVELSKLYGVTSSTIGNILRKHNVALRGNQRQVRCVETGVIYNSLKEVAKHLGFTSGTSIRNSCRDKNRTSGGFHWEYVD